MTTREEISFQDAPPLAAELHVATADRASSSKLGVPGPRSDLSPTINAIVEELERTFFGILPATVVARCATRAVQDLLGSICLQALPEMAIRLATVRLETGRIDTGRIDAKLDTEPPVTVPLDPDRQSPARLETVPPEAVHPGER